MTCELLVTTKFGVLEACAPFSPLLTYPHSGQYQLSIHTFVRNCLKFVTSCYSLLRNPDSNLTTWFLFLQELSAATENIPLKGRQFIPRDQAVLDRLEPYMTTNNWYHRTFSKHELSRGQYPRKDVGTYWQCEEYPKAWGHGMKQNPLRRRLNRSDPLPMTDRTVFKGITTHSHLLQPKSLQLVTK